MAITLKPEDGNVHVLRLDDGENRFTQDYLESMSVCLDELERLDGNAALVTTGVGKFFSNGLDLDWVGANPDGMGAYVHRIQDVFARLLSLPIPTVAAVNGHAFAGGGMLALCHDFTVMRSDRGWFCLPEVEIGIPFTPGMSALIQSRLSKATAHEAMVTARRYTGAEAVEAGLAKQAVPEAEVLPRAIALAASLAPKAGPTMAKIRTGMYRDVIEALRGSLG
ncbi:enoyl-CoA hydratase/isomerase family protein [Actinocorallia longicatena]|uniref:Enoyl-CoA hydratase/isomerase family protein n=1 Tax=Actinocorallia longicatena TaxID=111803 RepID=A0ABP6QBN8_9ACTN